MSEASVRAQCHVSYESLTGHNEGDFLRRPRSLERLCTDAANTHGRLTHSGPRPVVCNSQHANEVRHQVSGSRTPGCVSIQTRTTRSLLVFVRLQEPNHSSRGSALQTVSRGGQRRSPAQSTPAGHIGGIPPRDAAPTLLGRARQHLFASRAPPCPGK